ncbi:DNA-deoxyinosine glycosylase [Olsenella uli]|uniref:DNA-deoxyinosine glycosylase n=1 Tax=Olsenella uli TaxID=133926 RepID=UPI00195B217A|nr:DNA-deoxyinosine glycosylase [Olsenella uli]MBM6676240.1 DNA-deoxyinosine glycosylase [Olsenella uli]
MNAYQHIAHGFEPVFDERSRVLVLGSFPSVLSRENRFYYGNPRNRFWHVVADVLGEPEPATDDIAGKRALLLRHSVALWDVIESCDVRGSADASIRNVVPADVARVTSVAPIRSVLCNGGTAARLYHRWLEPVTGIAAGTLPSTSPANAAWSAERLEARWREALLAALAPE